MVWFQCEDCGENLKKPKLPNHFNRCSAYKLSCIDCGVTFNQETVQAHTQCISETEKYGPKGAVKAGSNTPGSAKSNTKERPEVDTSVGLTTRPPWNCSLCNTSATSQQTLLLHADGKKHRAKARAFHASQNPPKPAEDATPKVSDSTVEAPKEELVTKEEDSVKVSKKKRKIDSSDNDAVVTTEVVVEDKKRKVKKEKKEKGSAKTSEETTEVVVEEKRKVKKEKSSAKKSEETTEVVVEDKKTKVKKENGSAKKSEDTDEEAADTNEAGGKKIKWKKVITSILKEQEKTNFSLDKRVLQKAVINTLIKTNYVPADIDAKRRKELKEMVMQQVESCSKFTVDLNHLVKLSKKE